MSLDYREPAPEDVSVPEDYRANPEEFALAPPVENTSDEEEKEYEYQTKPERDSGKVAKLTRALLIQAAGVMVGAVVILNSFGVDHLGSDSLIGGSSKTTPTTPTSSSVTPTPTTAYDIDPMPTKASKWPTKVITHYHVTYLPTGDTYDSALDDASGEKDMKLWVELQGGDPDTMVLVKAKNSGGNTLKKSDDAIIVGSSDSPESIYLASGELWWEYERDEYYEAYASTGLKPVFSDSFPQLPNLDPDFAGDYAWAGDGSEEYLILDDDAGKHYLVAGTYYTSKGLEVYAGNSAMYYDKASNTLVLNYYYGDHIDANVMGNGFKIELHGENEIGSIRIWGAMYGGSVTFTGDGSLKINKDRENQTGLMLECEDSKSCIMVDREATVEVYGEYAIVIHRTMLQKAIYVLKPIEITGGECAQGEFVEYTAYVTDESGNVVLDENNQPISKVMTVKDIAEQRGLDLYDYSVVGSDGKPAPYVKFAPE